MAGDGSDPGRRNQYVHVLLGKFGRKNEEPFILLSRETHFYAMPLRTPKNSRRFIQPLHSRASRHSALSKSQVRAKIFFVPERVSYHTLPGNEPPGALH